MKKVLVTCHECSANVHRTGAVCFHNKCVYEERYHYYCNDCLEDLSNIFYKEVDR